MRTLFLSIAFLLAISVVAVQTGCEFPKQEEEPGAVEALALSELKVTPQVGHTWDTLSTSTSLDTATVDLGTYYNPVDFEFFVRWDSLTGGTNANFYIEWSPELSGDYWVAITTVQAFNGAGIGKARISGEIVRGRLRGRAYAPSSTQLTRFHLTGNAVTRIPN